MPPPSAPRREHAALSGTHLRIGLTAFVVISVYAVAVYHAVGYWRVTHDPGLAAVTAGLFQCNSGTSGSCQARFQYGGRSYVVGPIQGRGGQQVTLLVERGDPTSYRQPGGAGNAYGPLIAVVVLSLGALAFRRIYRPGAGAAAAGAPSPEPE